MRDLLAIVEGKDDAAVLRAVLIRPRDLGIRSVTFHTEQRASGVIARGPELAREQRREFRYVLCLWDHQGSGQETKSPSRVQGEVQARLNRNTLKGCSKALVRPRIGSVAMARPCRDSPSFWRGGLYASRMAGGVAR